MRLLCRPRSPPHQRLIQPYSQRATILRHLPRQPDCSRQHVLSPLTRLLEQGPEVPGVWRVGGTGGEQVHSSGVPDQSRQEEGGTRFHGHAATGEDEPVFRGRVADSDGGREGHCHAHADGRAGHGADCGLATAVDGEGDATSSVCM